MAATLKVDTITNAANAGTANLTLDASGNATVGNTLVMGSSFKRNRIINGNMAVDQRGTASSAVTLNNSGYQYTVDRWACATTTASSSTVTAQRISTGLSSFPYALRILRGSGTWTGIAAVDQTIETINCQDLAGQTVTVSIWLRAGSAFTGTFSVQGLSGSGTDQGLLGGASATWTGWAGPTIKSSSSATTTLTQYTFPWSVPAGTNEMALFITFTWSSGTGSANDYVDITGVQLETGSIATPYERQIYSDQLAQCQRYLPAYGVGPIGTAWVTSSTNAYVEIPHPVQTRAGTTGITAAAANTFVLYSNAAASLTPTAIAFNSGGISTTRLQVTVSSGLVQGNASALQVGTGPLLFTGCEL